MSHSERETEGRRHHRHRHKQREELSGANAICPGEGEYVTLLAELLREPFNKLCADCSETGTQWASVNLGLFLCIRCAGIHREMGTHISKVKSISMDSWQESEVHVMQALGNARGRAIFEARMPAEKRLTPMTSDRERRRRIEKKYMTGEYAALDAKKQLKAVHKQARYGRYAAMEQELPLRSPCDVPADDGSAAAPRRLAPELQEAALQALYGEKQQMGIIKGNTKGTQRKRDGEAVLEGAERKRSAKHKGAQGRRSAHQRGAFGVINVPEKDQSAKLEALLRCFGLSNEPATDSHTPLLTDPSPDPIPADGERIGACITSLLRETVAEPSLDFRFTSLSLELSNTVSTPSKKPSLAVQSCKCFCFTLSLCSLSAYLSGLGTVERRHLLKHYRWLASTPTPS
eukprot:gene898-526_t